MIVFLDTSVVLRKLFGEAKPLLEWPKIKLAIVSRLMQIEVSRVIDRYRLAGALTDAQVADLAEQAQRIYGSVDILALSEHVLRRAQGAFRTTLGTLDAIHLASALHWAEVSGKTCYFATHDAQLARAARSCGIPVIGA